MAEVVNKLNLQRDYKSFLYFIDGEGNVCRKSKKDKDKPNEIVVKNACVRDNNYLYYIDKNGDVSRSKRANVKKASA